jgi:23S rRNA pseudouridine1911/1915/1917 synthase
MLHARTLGFAHPKTGDQMEFSTPMPSDMDAVVFALQQQLRFPHALDTVSTTR